MGGEDEKDMWSRHVSFSSLDFLAGFFRFLVRVSGVNQVGFVGTESRLEGEGVG